MTKKKGSNLWKPFHPKHLDVVNQEHPVNYLLNNVPGFSVLGSVIKCGIGCIPVHVPTRKWQHFAILRSTRHLGEEVLTVNTIQSPVVLSIWQSSVSWLLMTAIAWSTCILAEKCKNVVLSRSMQHKQSCNQRKMNAHPLPQQYQWLPPDSTSSVTSDVYQIPQPQL